MNEDQDVPRSSAHALQSVGETKPPKHLKFLIANPELEFRVNPIRISDLRFSNRKKIAVFAFIFPRLGASPISNTSPSLARSCARSLVAPASCAQSASRRISRGRLFRGFLRVSPAVPFRALTPPAPFPIIAGFFQRVSAPVGGLCTKSSKTVSGRR